jgi:hypothetical protein
LGCFGKKFPSVNLISFSFFFLEILQDFYIVKFEGKKSLGGNQGNWLGFIGFETQYSNNKINCESKLKWPTWLYFHFKHNWKLKTTWYHPSSMSLVCKSKLIETVTCFGNIHVLVMRLLLERCGIQKISSFWNIEQKLVACTLLQKNITLRFGHANGHTLSQPWWTCNWI